MRSKTFTFCAMAMLLPIASKAATVYYLDTGQTMAQPSIDSADVTDWYGPSLGAPLTSGIAYVSTALSSLDATFNWDLGGGNFDLKDGSGTTADLTLSLWDGGLGGTEVAWVTWTNSDFCGYKSSVHDGCQQFNGNNPLPIYFTDDHTATGTPTPYTIQNQHSYLVELTSPAGTIGSVQYFIKAPQVVSIQDPNGVVLETTSTPEPGTLAMGLGGALLLFLSTRRRLVHAR